MNHFSRNGIDHRRRKLRSKKFPWQGDLLAPQPVGLNRLQRQPSEPRASRLQLQPQHLLRTVPKRRKIGSPNQPQCQFQLPPQHRAVTSKMLPISTAPMDRTTLHRRTAASTIAVCTGNRLSLAANREPHSTRCRTFVIGLKMLTEPSVVAK